MNPLTPKKMRALRHQRARIRRVHMAYLALSERLSRADSMRRMHFEAMEAAMARIDDFQLQIRAWDVQCTFYGMLYPLIEGWHAIKSQFGEESAVMDRLIGPDKENLTPDAEVLRKLRNAVFHYGSFRDKRVEAMRERLLGAAMYTNRIFLEFRALTHERVISTADQLNAIDKQLGDV